MNFKQKFDPSKFSYSEGWKSEEMKINLNGAADEITAQYYARRDIPLVTRNYIRRFTEDLKKSMSESDKTYTEYSFDINSSKIRKADREQFLELLGMFFDRVSSPHSDRRKTIPLSIEDAQEFEYILEHLERQDRTVRKQRDARYELTILNPAFAYYFYNVLPPLSQDSRKALMRGVLTNNLARMSNDPKSHEKIVFKSSNATSFDRIDLYSDLEKLHAISLYYPETLGGEKSFKRTKGETRVVPYNSIWYLKPDEVKDYIIEGFTRANDKLEALPDFSENPEKILTELITFKRIKTTHAAYLLGEMSIKERDEKIHEFNYHKRLLREWQATLDRLEKKQHNLEYFEDKDKIDDQLTDAKNHVNEIQPIVDQLHESLYGMKEIKKSKKKSDKWARDKEWDNQRAHDKYDQYDQ